MIFSDFYLINFLKVKLHKLKRMLSIPRKWSVLDIGSGDGPFPRADILCDKYLEDTDRVSRLVIDRPFVMGDIMSLPFIDNSFDFIYCSHVLEHIDNPVSAIKEIMRVGKRGYIELPSEFQEKMQSTISHKWYVKKEDNQLIFWKKDKEIFDSCIQQIFRKLIDEQDKVYLSLFFRHNRLFNIEYYWDGEIKYNVKGELPKNQVQDVSVKEIKKQIDRISMPRCFGLRYLMKKTIKIFFTTDKKFNLFEILACSLCKQKVKKNGDMLICENCGKKFPIYKKIPIMLNNCDNE